MCQHFIEFAIQALRVEGVYSTCYLIISFSRMCIIANFLRRYQLEKIGFLSRPTNCSMDVLLTAVNPVWHVVLWNFNKIILWENHALHEFYVDPLKANLFFRIGIWWRKKMTENKSLVKIFTFLFIYFTARLAFRSPKYQRSLAAMSQTSNKT